MTVSNYFNQFEASNEQVLLEDLVIESIRIYGHNVYYLPRTLDNKDRLYEQSDLVTYHSAHMVEMYIENFDGSGFTMDTNFLSKFGMEVRNQITFSVSQRVFQDQVNAEEDDLELTRPREGDLIYFPLNKKLFQIKFVDKFQMYYQLGALQTWKITAELFEYTGERLNTGIAEIDRLEAEFTPDLLAWTLFTEANNYLVTEANNYLVTQIYDTPVIDPLDDTITIQTESDVFVDFSEIDPFSEGAI